MTTKQFDDFRNSMDLHFSFKLHFDRSQALIDLILKSNNASAIESLTNYTSKYYDLLEQVINAKILSDNEKH